MTTTPSDNSTPSLWPHRLAVLLACATFPVIWVGGLVTTYDAGMSFPDWPTSYGYNVFLYPWQTWLSGPWNMFIEHGHRLLVAGIVGPVTIALTVLVFRNERRLWVRRLTWAAAVLVVLQAVLGGIRVVLDQRLLAQIHACVGPAFFALTCVLATVTSRRWHMGRHAEPSRASDGPAARPTDFGTAGNAHPTTKFARLATTTAAMAYIQLVIGSQLRHMQVTSNATLFRVAVWFHLLVAAALAAHVVLLWCKSLRAAADDSWLRRPTNLLTALLGLQIALGCGAWVVNYGWPAWLSGYALTAGYVVQRDSFLQATLTTGHVATGSLILAVSAVLAVRAWRAAGQAKIENPKSKISVAARSAPPSALEALA
ncbi:MAG TPA: COX15/CtaA family protein [Pirellulales bacterium]